eukprot:4140330-Prymnesium_polylepis.1
MQPEPCDRGAYVRSSKPRFDPPPIPRSFNYVSTCMHPTARWQCPAGSASSIACPAGTHSSSDSLASKSGCEVCPIGHACAVGASFPELCAPGRYGASPGQIDRQCSGACVVGFFCQAGSISNTSEACRMQRTDSSPVFCSRCPSARVWLLTYGLNCALQLLEDSIRTSAARHWPAVFLVRGGRTPPTWGAKRPSIAILVRLASCARIFYCRSIVFFFYTGYHQPAAAQSRCIPCAIGKYQPDFGALKRINGETGTYTNSEGANRTTDCPEGA